MLFAVFYNKPSVIRKERENMKKLISMVVCTLMLWSCTIPAFVAESNIDNDNIHSPAFCTDVISEIADSTVMAVYHQ